ncbi:hypothetical protein BD324DRAFT_608403 [Kockovaella imperatae]|uniref:Meiotically up-regulated protein Msb1/Mug8 domain-containing protein n=1 Tax=Kockovaella imperatae TaxID=4999 RepID=A0A1Y1UIY1_9TREE|nr:hypothetical protein BD324DRAFT_608403 [Kockovaella imperatae]ORX38018.1 hypothetical protein BD324DRAFT_608403 [Kockovaella imperatae]
MPTLFGRSASHPWRDKSSSSSNHSQTMPVKWRDTPHSTEGVVDSARAPLKPLGGRIHGLGIQSPSSSSTSSGNGPAQGYMSFDQAQRSSIGSGTDEFGAMQGSGGAVAKTLPSTTTAPLTPPASPKALLDQRYTFLPTRVSSMSHSVSLDSFLYSAEDVVGIRPYGFLGGVGSKVVVGLEDVSKVIHDVGRELGRRGVTTPMLFSNQALDLNPTRTRALIQGYIESISSSSSRKVDAWSQDLQFARDYELAWLFRWALSRITRIREGSREICHGVLDWDAYEEWRGRERASSYPLDAFPYLSAIVPAPVFHQILTPLFSLLSKFAAYSHISGLTPHTLSSLFAPLLFDIPSSSPCMSAHTMFVRAASATEHLLLAYVRSSSKQGGLGLTDLPSRLKDWVAGYPSMVASDGDLARANPRKGARVVRCERASRTVRSYSKDLVLQTESWAGDVVGSWDAWDRVILRGRRGESGRPKFTSAWRRRMAIKEMLPLSASTSTSSADLARKMSYGRAQKPGVSPPQNRRERRAEGESEDEARWASLAGKEWSMFEEGGFDSPLRSREELRTKLQFDLTESAKQGISERRRTMDWSEFASDSGGFQRTDPLLDASLTFSAPLSESITDWPKERDELHKRLQKSQKEAVPFNYDTTPRVGASVSQDPGSRADGKGRVYLEEAFLDCWADWMMGGGWADREELTFKEANWVLIEYKARPSRNEDCNGADPLADPRSSELCFLFEERVPTDYQVAIADPKQKKTFGLFGTKKKRTGGSGATSRSPRAASQWENTDFDRMLIHRDRTKKLTLSSKAEAPHTAIWHITPDVNIKSVLPRSPAGASVSPTKRDMSRSRTRSSGKPSDPVEEAKVNEGKASFFSNIKNRDRSLKASKMDEAMRDKYKRDPERQRAKEVDFEIQSASGLSSPDDAKEVVIKPSKGVSGRVRDPDDDKWMDILIANGARRMDRQDAPPPIAKHLKTSQIGGLPVSPHPPRQYSPHPQALPADFDPYAAHRSFDDASCDEDHRNGAGRGYGGLSDQAALYASHSPETSGSTDAHEHDPMTPEEGADLARFPSWKRKPVPPLMETLESAEADGPPVVPPKSNDLSDLTPPRVSTASADQNPVQILSPSPTRPRDRDTIHRIVDGYSRASTASSDFEPASSLEYGDSPSRREYDYGHEGGESQADEHDLPPHAAASRFQAYDPDRLTPPDVTAAGIANDEMKPPGVIFDLTPGREPSPARYKHGEPLAFVGEEDEEAA